MLLSAFAALAPTGALAQWLLPDIVEEPPRHLGIQNDHQREFLRFSTTHWNQGAGPLQIRGGGQVSDCVIDGVLTQCTFATQEVLDASGNVVFTQQAGVAFFHAAHNHWHQSDVALFALHSDTPDGSVPFNGDGQAIVGIKVTFCLIDFDKSDLVHSNKTRVYFDCNAGLQGISRGWGDEYHHSTGGQELDLTGLAEGVYVLTQDADPTNHWAESDETNNRSWTKFRLSRKGANPETAVIEESPCVDLPLVSTGQSFCGNTSNK